jgi:hypothetical protein
LRPSWLLLLLVPWWSTSVVEEESFGGERRGSHLPGESVDASRKARHHV